MKALILGASGILGSHLRITPHPGITASYHRGRAACDLTNKDAVLNLLLAVQPDVIVNLAGESRPDVVEASHSESHAVNVLLPQTLAWWAYFNESHLVHVSTQAVFSGKDGPYGSASCRRPINEYGLQKMIAEKHVQKYAAYATIIRPTFVLGIRPDPTIGRPNPVELMLSGQKKQVNDRWFSPSFAPDVASLIWDVCSRRPSGAVIHAGVPVRVSRYDIAVALGCEVEACSHEDFPGIAPRPRDTTYQVGAVHRMSFQEGIQDCLMRWRDRENRTLTCNFTRKAEEFQRVMEVA